MRTRSDKVSKAPGRPRKKANRAAGAKLTARGGATARTPRRTVKSGGVTRSRKVATARNNEAPRAEHEFLTAMLDTVDALVVVIGLDGRIVHFNRACEHATGYRSEEVTGKTFWDLGLLPLEELDGVHAVFERLRAGESGVRWENHWVDRNGGRRLIAWSNSLLHDARGEVAHVLGTGIDVTEQRAAQDKLRIRTEELALLHRRYTASGLAAIIAHELNQPLAAIASYAEACLQSAGAGTQLPEHIAHNAEKIAGEALRAGRYVNGLRRLVTRGSAELYAENLNALVHSACEIVAPLARSASVRILFGLDERLPAVRAAAIQIEHVLVNLTRNAIEAIGAAGLMAGEVLITTRAAEGMAVVTVTDNGPGIEAEQTEAVFDPFFTTKDEGVGMGLAVCRTLVEAHGGRIWAEPGHGGIFHFTLPFAS